MKTEIIVRNRDSGGLHLQVQHLVQVIPWRQSKESIESPRSCRIRQSSGKIEAGNYQCHLSLFAGFKRESTQNSNEYNLVIWTKNLFDVLDLNI